MEKITPLEQLPEIKGDPGVQPEDTMAEAGRKVIRFHFVRMVNHEEGTRLGVDIEELHDMRVATRRMRAAFRVFKGAYRKKVVKPIIKGLQATRKALGRVRDLDVFMAKANHYLKALREDEQHGLDPLLTLWSEEREKARGKMLTYLDSAKFDKFKRDFYEFLHTPGSGTRALSDKKPKPVRVAHVAPVLIYSCLADVRAYENLIPDATLEQLHQLRIAFKRLRYTVEFFEEVLGEEADEVIDDLKKLQDHLGDLNDARVACEILTDFLEDWGAHRENLPPESPKNPEPIIAYLKAKRSESDRLYASFPDTWAYFHRKKFRQNLAAAVSVL